MKNQANFASIDFETANHSRVSVCAVGLAVFEDGQLTESLYWLVRPPKSHGWFLDDFIGVHRQTQMNVLTALGFNSLAEGEFFARLAHADDVVGTWLCLQRQPPSRPSVSFRPWRPMRQSGRPSRPPKRQNYCLHET